MYDGRGASVGDEVVIVEVRDGVAQVLIDLTKLLAGVTPATPPPALEEDVELVAE